MLIPKLFAFPMAAVMVAGSSGMDMDYQGEVDIYTGRPITDTAAESSQQTVAISEGVTYDRSAHMFSYSMPDNSGMVKSSVADGMVTTGKVSIELPSGFSAALYCDGEETDGVDYTAIADPGGYALVVTGTETQLQLLSFQIIPEKTGALNSFQLPKGFKLTRVALDNEPKNMIGKTEVDMKAEGYYEITYRCTATGIDYNLNVEVDHTPPMLVLEGVKDGIAHGPVVISGMDAKDSVYLTLDENKISVPMENKLKTPGKYHITVTDDAGNQVSEDFEIEFYLNMQGVVFTLLAVGVAAAIFIYMYVSKKRLKVR